MNAEQDEEEDEEDPSDEDKLHEEPKDMRVYPEFLKNLPGVQSNEWDTELKHYGYILKIISETNSSKLYINSYQMEKMTLMTILSKVFLDPRK